MPVLIVPAALRNTSNGIERFDVSGRTLRDVFNAVRKDAPELYNLRDDPGELKNLFEAEPDVAQDLDRRMRAFTQRLLAHETS